MASTTMSNGWPSSTMRQRAPAASGTGAAYASSSADSAARGRTPAGVSSGRNRAPNRDSARMRLADVLAVGGERVDVARRRVLHLALLDEALRLQRLEPLDEQPRRDARRACGADR